MPDSHAATIQDIAARWVVRTDRRLSPSEAAELESWLAADPRHAAAFARSSGAWENFRQLGSAVRRSPAPVSSGRPWWRRNTTLEWSAAAALVMAILYFTVSPPSVVSVADRPVASNRTSPVTKRLADGSVARMKGDSEIVELFTPTERRIRLVNGEAYFTVTKDASRPFLVEVGNITVRAVGTAFSVRSAVHDVDVWVTEGTVQVTPPAIAVETASRVARDSAAPALVSAGHRAVVTRTPEVQVPPIVVTAVTAAEIASTLAWNEPMLELAGSTLGELVANFSARSGRRIDIADPALRTVRIGGRFPSDDLEGFIHALERIYDVKADYRSDGTITLRSAR